MDSQINILAVLLHASHPVSNKTLQGELSLSRRSVINHIQALNDQYGDLIQSSQKGYSLSDHQYAAEIVRQAEKGFKYEGYENRRKYILRQLLMPSEKASLEVFEQVLSVSTSTLEKDIVRLKRELKDRDLTIRTKNGRLYIAGSTVRQRELLFSLLQNEWETSFFDWKTLAEAFPHAHFEEIHGLLSQILTDSQFQIDDFSLFNFTVHLALLLEDNSPSPLPVNPSDVDPDFLGVVDQIRQEIRNISPNRSFTREEILSASFLASTRVRKIHPSPKEKVRILQDPIADPETQDLLSRIISSVYDSYGLDLNDENFRVRLGYHLANVLVRARNHSVIPSVPPQMLKESFPFLYTLARFIRRLIETNTNLEINDSELMYFALHLGSFVSQVQDESRIHTSLVCLNYLHSGSQTSKSIKEQIPEIDIDEIVFDPGQISENSDLIVSTISLPVNTIQPSVEISMFPTFQDIQILRQRVNEILHERRRKKLQKQFMSLFHDELLFLNVQPSSSKDLIKLLAEGLKSKGYVDESYLQRIWEHETVLPTEYGSVAIPHPLSDDGFTVKKSGIAVWMSRKAVKWVKNDVRYVFMLALRPEDLHLIPDVFGAIATVTDDISKQAELMACTTAEDIVGILSDQMLEKERKDNNS